VHMILTPEESSLFLKLYKNLLLFTNQKLRIDKNIKSVEEYDKAATKRQLEIRNQLYENIKIIDEFYEDNPANLAELELGQLIEWKKFIKDKFLFYKQYKKYCAILYSKQAVVLGIKGLTQPLDEILPFFPIYVQTVLLPFKDKIVADGFFETFSIHFSGNIKKVLKNDYDIAKCKFGIIEQFPITQLSEVDEKINLLKYYIKNTDKSSEYDYKIEELITEEPSLEKIYHQELWKKYSKLHAKKLIKCGFDKKWFACFDELIIASGQEEQELKDNIDKIVPDKLKEFIHIFKL
jgi:hypothetical protein